MYNEPTSIPKPTTITVKREGFFLTPDGKDFLSTFLAFLSSLRMLEVVLWGDIQFPRAKDTCPSMSLFTLQTGPRGTALSRQALKWTGFQTPADKPATGRVRLFKGRGLPNRFLPTSVDRPGQKCYGELPSRFVWWWCVVWNFLLWTMWMCILWVTLLKNNHSHVLIIQLDK